MNDKDLAAEYLALKAANDQLREHGKQWLWDTLGTLTSEINRSLNASPAAALIQVGRQDGWQFKVDAAVMVGERFGARLNGRTLVVEAGWPRLAEHGFISDGGLARGRIAISQNTILEPQPLAELILKRQGAGDVAWFQIRQRHLGNQLIASALEQYLQFLLRD